jgi:hypothetical protein
MTYSFESETFEKHPLSPDFGVRLSRHGGINPQNTPCILAVEIFAFLELKRN